jgi:hypothetical protein
MEITIISILLGILVTILAWIGNRIHIKIDHLTEKLDGHLNAVNNTLRGIENDLREDLVEHDRRITALEVYSEVDRWKEKHSAKRTSS